MNSVPPWLATIQGEVAHLVSTLPTTTLLIDMQRGNATYVARDIISTALCLHPVENKACWQCKSCHQLAINAHPDCIWIEQPCKINQIRALGEHIQHTPSVANRRVIFLANIDQYHNDYALNALLKILEEPPESNYFILSAANRYAVMSTILSRARCVTVPMATRVQAIAWLCHIHHWTQENAEAALALQQDNPFTVLKNQDRLIDDCEGNNTAIVRKRPLQQSSSSMETDKTGESVMAQKVLSPVEQLDSLIDFLCLPSRNTMYLLHLEKIQSDLLIDYILAQLGALILFIQSESCDKYWWITLEARREDISLLDINRLHVLYARIAGLRHPSVQQVGVVTNIREYLLDMIDNRIPIL